MNGATDRRQPPAEGTTASPILRDMEAGDVDRVVEIERRAFTTPWSADTFRRLIERPGAELMVLERRPEGVVAYAVLWCVLDQGELANIAVADEYRGTGLGSRLLDAVMKRARDRGVRKLFLEVRVSNEQAARMYEKRGFEEVGRRRDYYDRPREDARVLAKRLDREP